MKRIIRIGMDVHSKSYNLCALESIWGQKDRLLVEAKVAATADEVARFIKALAKRYGLDEKTDILCGYEAGCFGYSLYHQLRERKIPLCYSGSNDHACSQGSTDQNGYP